jgi:hypothetical protein
MNETERWIQQARNYLKSVRWGGRRALGDFLQDHLTKIDMNQAESDLGCGDHCAECSWGLLGGHPLRETCKLVALQEAIDDLQARPSREAPAPRTTAALLEILDSLPVPRKH